MFFNILAQENLNWTQSTVPLNMTSSKILFAMNQETFVRILKQRSSTARRGATQ